MKSCLKMFSSGYLNFRLMLLRTCLSGRNLVLDRLQCNVKRLFRKVIKLKPAVIMESVMKRVSSYEKMFSLTFSQFSWMSKVFQPA